MSPGVNPRPSLNEVRYRTREVSGVTRVAGGEPPALIERSTEFRLTVNPRYGVAGGEPPALIERSRASPPGVGCELIVSPGVNPRPSLNGLDLTVLSTRLRQCRRG